MMVSPVAYMVHGEFRRAVHIKYDNADVPTVDVWKEQGTIYDTSANAKFAAAKLYTAYKILGVVVKKCSGGYSLFFWVKK